MISKVVRSVRGISCDVVVSAVSAASIARLVNRAWRRRGRRPTDARMLIRRQQCSWGRSQGYGQLIERNDGRIPPAAFEIRNVLLRKAGAFGKLLLGHAKLRADATHVSPDELAHIHAQSIGDRRQVSLSTIVCRRVLWLMLDFRNLLELVEIDPAETLIVRHIPIEKSMKRVLPWLVLERPDLWLAYQRIQWRPLEKAMTRGGYFASFIGQDAAAATFAGIYRIGEWEVLDYEGYARFPGNSELKKLGATGRSPDMPDCLAFELEPTGHYANWVGRLTITWPKPYQQWWRWGGRGRFPVATIEAESRFVRGMPDWKELVLSWHELQSLPSSWCTSLAQWRGVYLIYDASRKAGYVGSAYGADNILGRWRNYAQTGHGGNRELRNSEPADLRFSILQRTSPDLEPSDVISLEASWKERLHTRQFGLNMN